MNYGTGDYIMVYFLMALMVFCAYGMEQESNLDQLRNKELQLKKEFDSIQWDHTHSIYPSLAKKLIDTRLQILEQRIQNMTDDEFKEKFNNIVLGFKCGNDLSTCWRMMRETQMGLAQQGNLYQEEPYDAHYPIDEDSVVLKNKFWKSMKGESQKVITQAIKKIVYQSWTDLGYHKLRYQIAASVYLGAKMNVNISSGPLIDQVTLFNDLPLAQLMLSKMDSNDDNHLSEPSFFGARSVAMAELFLAHGTNINRKKKNGETYLHQVVSLGHDKALITWCKQKGLSPLTPDKDGWTVLHTLAILPSLKRGIVLLEGLDNKILIELIQMKSKKGKTASDILQTQTTSDARALLAFLQEKLTQAQQGYEGKKDKKEEDTQRLLCPICDEQSVDTFTTCAHGFCKPCLTSWLNINNTCPLCRKKQV